MTTKHAKQGKCPYCGDWCIPSAPRIMWKIRWVVLEYKCDCKKEFSDILNIVFSHQAFDDINGVSETLYPKPEETK